MPYGQYGGGTVAVGVAPPTLLFVGSVSGALIQNNGAVLVYIGGSTVTANTAATGGLTIAAGVTLAVPDTSAGLYAVVASGTANVAWLAPG